MVGTLILRLDATIWKAFGGAIGKSILSTNISHRRTMRPPSQEPMSLHGDEGRGQKKGHVFVAMLEANLGLENLERKRRLQGPEPWAKRCCRGSDFRRGDGGPQLERASTQVTNLKGHSFLTKFVMCALPTKIIKPTDDEEATEEPLVNMLSLI